MPNQAHPPRPLTGTKVLLAFVAFFAVIAGMNAVMLRAATSTFGGVEVASAYRAGLAFNDEIAAAARLDALHWKGDVEIARQNGVSSRLVVKLNDPDGKPASGIEIVARMVHPADARRDHRIALRETGLGAFEGTTDATPGRWDLLLEARRTDETVFRSRSRLMLK
jgi:nitrogen fixation protein FixH